jgi:hypothetical protein
MRNQFDYGEARVHHAARRCGQSLADRSARAAGRIPQVGWIWPGAAAAIQVSRKDFPPAFVEVEHPVLKQSDPEFHDRETI